MGTQGLCPKLKYFQHAGAMLTADGSDDHLIKLEAAPPGYKLAIPRPPSNKHEYVRVLMINVAIA